jgi:4-amino-4-deoxy-L-arabinose transferase-like glycosyltransferase
MIDKMTISHTRRLQMLRVSWLGLLGVLLSIFDLLAPLTSSTIWRQTQTAMLTHNYVTSGFSLHGLRVEFMGPARPLMVQEFPFYNLLTGLASRYFGHPVFWGKLVSLAAFLIALALLLRLVERFYGSHHSWLAGLLFVISPLCILVRTSFQPDALGLMFLLLALDELVRWREEHHLSRLSVFAAVFLLAGWEKFPIIVPYLPIVAFLFCTDQNGFRIPRLRELAVIVIVFLLPFLAWYLYAMRLTDPQLIPKGLFLLGDLHRFFRLSYYVKPAFIFGLYVFCGTGLIFGIAALPRSTVAEYILAAGIPLYLFVIPTASEQHYYEFAIMPIAAVLMTIGAMRLAARLSRRQVIFFGTVVASVYVLVCCIATLYLLRRDRVFPEAGKAVAEKTEPGDLLVSLVLHDRVYLASRDYPILAYPVMHYFAQRTGWDLYYGSWTSQDDVERQLRDFKAEGARYLVVTWYSADLEPKLTSLAPRALRRDPQIDGKKIFNALSKEYRFVAAGPNYGILQLGQ